jgi:eukaryotic-like serine/threonine-protein kinase
MPGGRTPDHEHRVEEICAAALERPLDQRARFLEVACRGDLALRAEVESLLLYDEACPFIDRTALEVAAEELAVQLPDANIGRYHLLGPLGSGGMGDVYRARDTVLERDVAIKLLPEAFATDPRRRHRFEQEARLLASLNHPHIAAAYDFETGDGASALVLELVEGETLQQMLARRRAAGVNGMPVAEALTLAVQVADALEAAHRAGIVHQDLKPANIVIRPDGQPKVLDFGLAAALPGDAQLSSNIEAGRRSAYGSEDGLFFGTPAYMSPEQWQRRVDPKSDIWAFGCILFEMLTGQPAFSHDASEYLPSTPTFGQPAWKLVDPQLPPGITTFLAACLELEAWARPDARTVLGVIRALQERLQNDSTDDSSSAPIRSLAVLPVAGGDASHEAFLREGLAEQITDRLSPLPQLKVMAANTVFRYYAIQSNPQILALQLGVQATIASRFVPEVSGLRVDVALLEPLDGLATWNRSYPVPDDGIGRLAELIASDVVEVLRLDASAHRGQPLSRRASASAESFCVYLKGRFHWNKRTAHGFVRAVDYFHQAVRLDPGFALAYVAIADCYAVLPFYDEAVPSQAYEHARAAVDRALALDQDLADAHAALGHLQFSYEWDWTAAESSLQRAVVLAPSNVWARHVRANFLTAVGRLADARREFDVALALDPVSLPLNADSGVLSYFARDYDAAVDQFGRTVELDPHFASVHAFLGWAQAHRQEYELALASGHTALKLSDTSWIRASLGYTYALAGDIAAARTILRELQHRADNTYVSPYDLAISHALLGDHDRALACLHAALAERSGVLVWGVLNDPRLDPLRQLPPFQQLLHQLGLLVPPT